MKKEQEKETKEKVDFALEVGKFLPETKQKVESIPGLTLHMSYATWNGPGWFQKFAKKINDAVKSGITNPKEVSKISIDARKNSGNSLIAQGAKKVSDIMGSNYS